jgi:hypothetical protein
MSALFHIIVETIRIAILSIVYGYLIWLLVKGIFKSRKLKKRFLIPLLFIALFLWRFSYWGNEGLGDNGRVPLGSGYEVEILGFSKANIKKDGESVDSKGRASNIEKLYVEDGVVYYTTGTKFRIYDPSGEKTHINNLGIEEFKLMGANPRKLMSADKFHADYWGYGILFY